MVEIGRAGRAERQRARKDMSPEIPTKFDKYDSLLIQAPDLGKAARHLAPGL